mgnify:CR=1 FL=1
MSQWIYFPDIAVALEATNSGEESHLIQFDHDRLDGCSKSLTTRSMWTCMILDSAAYNSNAEAVDADDIEIAKP